MSGKNSENQTGDRLKESLSVTLDGQAGELELRRVLDGVGHDGELRAVASRYQLIGDAIRGETNRFSNVDMSASVMEAIEQEEVDQLMAVGDSVESGKSGSYLVISMLDGWWSSLGRAAMAASVAFAVVFGVKNLNVGPETQYVAVNEPAVLSQPLSLTPGGQNSYGANSIRAGYNSKQHDSVTPEQLAYAQSVADRATKERFRAYALQHAELSAINGQGILPFARLTSFDAQ
ncbi:hypothetical protein ACH42_14240 [Endozoicomonas sp. (ex Bugula neritina AB1)]|nr:hypothetical protein ACH42_14240 [Endozoicomonas sp. (ex Bugula neritina AB1)]